MDEMMNYETVEEMEEEYEECENSDLGKGVLIGAGAVGAGFALFKLGQKVWSKFKKKKDAAVELDASTKEKDIVEADD